MVWAYETITKYEQTLVAPGLAVPETEVARSFGIIINTKNPIVSTIRISKLHELDLVENSIENVIEKLKKEIL